MDMTRSASFIVKINQDIRRCLLAGGSRAATAAAVVKFAATTIVVHSDGRVGSEDLRELVPEDGMGMYGACASFNVKLNKALHHMLLWDTDPDAYMAQLHKDAAAKLAKYNEGAESVECKP